MALELAADAAFPVFPLLRIVDWGGPYTRGDEKVGEGGGSAEVMRPWNAV